MKLCSLPYEEYRDGDNEWYELIPSTWNEKRVKNIFKLITDIAPNNNDFELLSLYASIGVRPRKDMEQRGNKAVTTDGYWMVRKGDIIVNKLLAWMGAIGLSEYDGVTSPAYDILRKFNQNVDARFYTYLFRTEKAQAIFKKHSRGIMDVRLRLYFDKLGAITVPFPSIAEQKSIAHYLDTKTAQIDRKIDLLTQKATLYGNLKQSLINETVARGLDKTAPMQDSGIEWLGEVPKNWKISRIKNLGILSRGVDLPRDDFVEGIFPVYGSNGIIGYHSDYTTKAPCLTVGRSGSVGEVNYVSENFWAHNTTLYLQQSFNNNIKFIFYLFKSLNLQSFSAGSAVGTLNRNVIHQLKIAIPPVSEQKEIAHYLDTKTAQIDQIIQTINTQIEKLKELRKTLINDVVTGKIKVAED